MTGSWFCKMATEDVHLKLCQQEIVKLDLQVKALIQDIRDCDGPIETLQDLNKAIRDKVKSLKRCIQELDKLADQQDRETDKQALKNDVANHHLQLQGSQSSLRQANVMCHLKLEKKEKELLMGNGELRHRPMSSKEDVAKTAGGITESLMSLSRMMASQVSSSEQTVTTLVSSSRQITETNEEFKTMSGHIQNSRKLLTKYSRREFTDKLLIFLALVFFFATVLYIMKKRLLTSDAVGS